ncbi:MAG TPA: GNAT family N-acetyltransferase [Acidimicrobiales bacterium]|nr:GNAT family N-acetyltransferase [Acidimicrobiales bacterium]
MSDPAPPSGLSVDEAHEVTPELVDAFARLVPQLSRSAATLQAAELAEMVEAPGTHLLVARQVGDGAGPGPIVGTLTLVVFRIPTGVRAWIEDVVVDEAARGRGVGQALTAAAIGIATAKGARTVDLTSRPSREAANRLYARMGFELRDTNVYRYSAEGGAGAATPGQR